MSNLTNRPVTPKNQKRSRKDRIKKSTHWAAKYGTDEEYQAFVRKQPSAFSGNGPCIFAHYRTAANSGIGCKPEYSGVPLTFTEHAWQHQLGTYNFMERVWWERQTEKYLKLWIRSLKQ
jgi:hypothetical protein